MNNFKQYLRQALNEQTKTERNQMNLNKQLQEAYEAGRRAALNEQSWQDEPSPIDLYFEWLKQHGRTRSLKDGTLQYWDEHSGTWQDFPPWHQPNYVPPRPTRNRWEPDLPAVPNPLPKGPFGSTPTAP